MAKPNPFKALTTIVVATLCAGLLALSIFASSSQAAPYPAGTPYPDGKIVFWSGRDTNSDATPNTEIYMMDPDGSNQINLTNNPAADFWPQFSPDGASIVFGRDPDFYHRSLTTGDDDFDLWMMNADGSNQRNLTNTPGVSEYMPAFSPDGTRIAFTIFGHGDSDVWVMNADGSNRRNLTNTPGVSESYAAFSPDGTKIAYVRDGNIWTMDSSGSKPTQLTSSPGEDSFPRFSPDGSQIVFDRLCYSGSVDSDIFVMNADGSNQRNITPGPASDYAPTFSPDGKRIAFSRIQYSQDYGEEAHGYEIYVMNADGSNPGRLTFTGWNTVPYWVLPSPYPNPFIGY